MLGGTRMWLVAGIFALAAFFRLFDLTTTPPGLYLDEAMDGNSASEVVETRHPQVFYTEDNGREGLYANLIAALLGFLRLPHEPWVIRLPAAVAGVLTVLGIYLLGRQLFGTAVGLLAAFLLATSFWHVNFSRIGFRGILAPLFLTWSLYFLVKTIVEPCGPMAFVYSILAGLAFSAGFYTYIAYRIAPAVLMIFIPFLRTHRGFSKRFMLFAAVTAVGTAPIAWYFANHPDDFAGRTSQVSVISSNAPFQVLSGNIIKTLAMFHYRGDDNWRHNVSAAPQLFLPVGILFLLGILTARGSFAQGKLGRFGLRLMTAWWIVALLPAVFSNEGVPHALRSILALPPTMIFAALGGVWLRELLLSRWLWNRPLVATLSAAFLLSCGIAVYVQYFVIWARDPHVRAAFDADYVAIGRQINSLPLDVPKYVIVSAGGDPIRGLPASLQTTMFITDTFTAPAQASKHVYYLFPEQTDVIAPDTAKSNIFHIN